MQELQLDKQAKYYMVVDRVRVPDIEEFVYRHEANPDIKFLFKGSPLEHILELSPVMINYSGAVELADAWKNDFAIRSSSVVFAVDKNIDEYEVFAHLQSLLTVQVQGVPKLLRFYSSHLWQSVNNQLVDDDVQSLLGPCQSVYWVTDDRNVTSLNRINEPDPVAPALHPITLQSDIFQTLV